MTPEKLQALKKLCDEATPGPWEKGCLEENLNEFNEHGEMIQTFHACGPGVKDTHGYGQVIKDAAFIVASRTALPELIDEVERLQDDLEFANDVVKERESWAAMRLQTCKKLEEENTKLRELLHDLNAVIKTAMHNGHHDLIQRVSDVCKEGDL